VEPVIERVQTADGRPGVHVAWEIREGEPAYVNRVTIAGNTFTHEDVIRERIYLLPGDVYNEELLIQSYRSITGLGFFETPGPTPQIEPNENGDVDITFQVKEKQTGSVNFGTAIGGIAGVSGFLGYDQPNLFGQAKSGHLRWEFGQYANNFEASYTDPALFGSRVSGSISLFDARNNFNRFFSFSEGAQRRTGAGLNVGLPLPYDRWSRLSLGYSLARVSYDDESGGRTSVFAQPSGVQSTVSIGLLRNTLNHPIFPTAGTSHSLQAELSGGPLGGDGDFQKYTASGSWWVPVGQLGGGSPGGRPIQFALGLSAEGGAIFGAESSLERFPFERFWMGGVQFGRPLRGYEETTITPTGYHRSGTVPLEERFGDAYMRLSAEYAVRVNDNLSLSAFYDAGSVWRRPSDVNPTRLLRGAGVGAVLVTPFGPLGLDYAYGFDKDEPGWQLHFKMGSGL
jgi:outer membrane protein insertion porin family